MKIHDAMDLAYKLGFEEGKSALEETIEMMGNNMINANEAKMKVINKEQTSKYWTSIIAKIYESINMTLLHCVWYTPPMHNCSEEEVEIIKGLVEKLEKLGYVCSLTVFEPNENFSNTRVKLNIDWNLK